MREADRSWDAGRRSGARFQRRAELASAAAVAFAVGERHRIDRPARERRFGRVKADRAAVAFTFTFSSFQFFL
jgi:hypothetical protein